MRLFNFLYIMLLLTGLFCCDSVVCKEDLNKNVEDILMAGKYEFSSDDRFLENFTCDVLLPLEDQNANFKIRYKKGKFFNISCFNDKELELLSVTNDNISFFSKGKYFTYLRKNMKLQIFLILKPDEFNSKFCFEKEGQDGFLIDISEMTSFLLLNKESVKTKKLSNIGGGLAYEINFIKKSVDKTADITLSLDADSELFSALEIVITPKGDEQKKIFRISNVVYNSPTFSELEEKELFSAKNKYKIEDIEVINKEFEGQELTELILSLLDELSDEQNFYYHSGLINVAQGKDAEAIEDFLKVLNIDKNNIKAYKNLSTIYLSMEDFKNALLYSEEGLKLYSEDSGLYQNKGGSLIGLGDYKNAEVALKKAIQLGENNETIYMSHAMLATCYLAYNSHDYYQKALEELKIAEKLNDNEEERADVSRLIKELEDKLKGKK
ncbi:MAG: hypothetical protein ABH952_07220 [Candidatus Omnitrophota bacterium]